ncbi:MAG: hypothetical protein IJJ06_12555 [Mogibacterium sp.]|nr:hypothetical protein [Mogibacterium sp.]
MKTTKIIAITGIMAALLLSVAVMPVRSFARENMPVTIEIPITYIVNGNDEIAGGDTFTLEPDDPDAPMPGDAAGGKKAISISKEGSYSFGSIYCDRPGVWRYTISRDLTEKKGVTKDDSIYRAKVIALNDGHGYVLVYLGGSDEKHELVYTDRVAPDTGDYENSLLIYSGLAAAAAAAFITIAAFRHKNRKKEA